MKQITKSLMRFVFTIALLFGSTSAWAQYFMDVTTKDGNRILIPVTNVDSVRIVNESEYNTPSGSHNGYEYVDLGLSVMWASYNVGANSPEETGDLFAWGEVTPKNEYTDGNYIYENDAYEYIKYVNDSTNIYFDNIITLDKCDDAARYNMGGNWRMPTVEEIKELIQNATFTNTTYNGVNGVRIFSKINGNSIFLPSYVYKNGQDYYAVYWSGSLLNGKEYGNGMYYGAYGLQSVGLSLGGYIRYQGMNVRAVCSPKEDIPTITATIQFDANGGSGEMTAISVWSDDSSTSFTLPSNSFVRDGYKFIGWNTKADGSGISYAPNERVNFSGDITLYAQWEEPTIFDIIDGKTVRLTESVGTEAEAAYGVLVTLLSEEDIANAGVVQDGFTAADYIGLRLTYNWYGLGVNCNYCIYINKKDYSVSAPEQITGLTDENFIYHQQYGYGEEGYYYFIDFSGSYDPLSTTLTMSFTADWYITAGQYANMYLQFGADNYKVEFGEIIE